MNRLELNSDALFLDLDGTLIEIAATPDSVIVPDGLVKILSDLERGLGGAFAIVTGRPISDVDRFLAPFAPAAAGIHGAELRSQCDGHIEATAPPIDRSIVDAVHRLANSEPSVIVEEKRASIAVHHRLAPAAGPRLQAALERILEQGPDHLILCPGRKVLEVVPRQVSKGTALEHILSLPRFRGRRPIMIGDDRSDETAFAAAVRLGGCGLKVAGENFSIEAADFANPAEVRAWLAAQSRMIP